MTAQSLSLRTGWGRKERCEKGRERGVDNRREGTDKCGKKVEISRWLRRRKTTPPHRDSKAQREGWVGLRLVAGEQKEVDDTA